VSAPAPRSQVADIARQARALLVQVRESRWTGFDPPAARSSPAGTASPDRSSAAASRHPSRTATAPERSRRAPAAITAAAPLVTTPMPAEPSPWNSLEQVALAVSACTKCPLHATRTKTVPGEGDAQARLMFIGEAPGADEDRLGRPFVGAAGHLLDKMIGAMGFPRERVFIANILKCRPPGNRDPQEHEVAACLPYLRAQIALIRPRVLCSLGRHAAHALLGRTDSLSRLRGRFFEYRGTPLMPTYHPSYLLRTPADKTAAWKDLRQVMHLLGQSPPERHPTEESEQ